MFLVRVTVWNTFIIILFLKEHIWHSTQRSTVSFLVLAVLLLLYSFPC